jgi:hypothetical protein
MKKSPILLAALAATLLILTSGCALGSRLRQAGSSVSSPQVAQTSAPLVIDTPIPPVEPSPLSTESQQQAAVTQPSAESSSGSTVEQELLRQLDALNAANQADDDLADIQ